MATQSLMTDPNKDLVNYRVIDGIALLTLNDPPANTYSYDMMQQIDVCVLKARMDEAVQLIVITGSGEKFSNRLRPSDYEPFFYYDRKR